MLTDQERYEFIRRWSIKEHETDRSEKFVNCFRLLCDGVVIDQVSRRLQTHFAMNLLERFKQNIADALSDPTWTFGGRVPMTAEKWLEYQRDRLGVVLTKNLEIVNPGTYYPVCTGVYKENERAIAKRSY
jgi:hypothetical protein